MNRISQDCQGKSSGRILADDINKNRTVSTRLPYIVQAVGGESFEHNFAIHADDA